MMPLDTLMSNAILWLINVLQLFNKGQKQVRRGAQHPPRRSS